MWLSIIIPLFNCEKYITRCLDSILRQGLMPDEYEVLIVDDGSSDRSPQIVAEYCDARPNFMLYRQPNTGVGAARNRGIDHAKAEYIEFIDADDWLLDGALSILKTYVDGKADMYTFWSRTVDAAYDPKEWDAIGSHHMLMAASFGDYATRYGFGWSVWSRIIRRKLIIDSGIRFSDHKVGEDVLFLAHLMGCTDALVVATNLNIYRYFVHPASAVNSADAAHNRRACLGYIEIYKSMQELARTQAYPAEVYERELHTIQVKTFLRMISGADSLSGLKALRASATECGALPISHPQGHAERLYNLCYSHSILLYPLSTIYRHVFLKHIKARIKRN